MCVCVCRTEISINSRGSAVSYDAGQLGWFLVLPFLGGGHFE